MQKQDYIESIIIIAEKLISTFDIKEYSKVEIRTQKGKLVVYATSNSFYFEIKSGRLHFELQRKTKWLFFKTTQLNINEDIKYLSKVLTQLRAIQLQIRS